MLKQHLFSILVLIALLAGCGNTGLSQSPNTSSVALVYLENDNLWLLDASGTTRQLTVDGGYRSPSMAKDGAVGALRSVGGQTVFVKLSASGEVLSQFSQPPSLNTILAAKLSPDGSTFAFNFQAGELADQCFSPDGSSRWPCTRLAFTPADGWSYEEGTTQVRFSDVNFTSFDWVDDAHLVAVMSPYVMHYTRSTRDEAWFDANEELKGESGWYWYDLSEADLSPSGQLLAVGRQLTSVDVSGEPTRTPVGPWEIAIYRRSGSEFTSFQPELSAETSGRALSLSFSSDESAVAYADDSGLKLISLTENESWLLDPEGSAPAWRP